MEVYVPKRLQNYFDIREVKHGNNITVKGFLSCCEKHIFRISYLGELKANLIGAAHISSEDNRVVLVAKCENCGQEILVFSGYTDGYDNYGSDSILPQLLDLKKLSCTKCTGGCFSLDIHFEYQSKEELEKDGVLTHDNAFSWIWISAICLACKKKYRKIIDIETS